MRRRGFLKGLVGMAAAVMMPLSTITEFGEPLPLDLNDALMPVAPLERPLHIESLEQTLRCVTYRIEDIKLWQPLPAEDMEKMHGVRTSRARLPQPTLVQAHDLGLASIKQYKVPTVAEFLGES